MIVNDRRIQRLQYLVESYKDRYKEELERARWNNHQNLEHNIKRNKYIEQLESTQKKHETCIKHLESTQEIWYALEDAKPDEGVLVYVVGKFVEGLYLLQDNEWYSKEEVEDDPDDYASCVGLDYDSVTWWRTKPIPPSIENSQGE